MPDLCVEWEGGYGARQRTGWTVTLDGIVYVEFSRFLPWALVKAAYLYRRSRKDLMSEWSPK